MRCLEIEYQSTALAHKFEKKSGWKNLSKKEYDSKQMGAMYFC